MYYFEAREQRKTDWFPFVLSVLSSSCSPGVRQWFTWRWYCCSILPPLFFHSCLHTQPLAGVCMDLQYSMGGVWCVKMQHICPRATKTLKRTSQKDQGPAMYSIFIYLFNSTNLYSPQEWFTLSSLALSQQFPSWRSVTCICKCKGAAEWNGHGFNCSLRCSTRGTGGWVPYSRAPWH